MAKKPDTLVRFGKRVRQLRVEKGFSSQEAFADKCGLDRTYIGGIERGERNVSLVNVAKIAHALGMTISQLTQDV
jgi:transcriptional regulator with XRE-family HTH domain